MANPLFQQHFISVSDCSSDTLDYLLQTAMRLKKTPQPHLLDGKLIASCFFEPSTRTRLSFETAVQRLGGKVIGFADGASTSAKKGETLADTARIISNYADAVILRHPKDGAARVAGDFATVPVVNAGDGTNQHPTQTLLDLLTIFETQGRIDNLNIAMIGDLKYGRTVHSLAQALSRRHNRFAFVSPAELAMPDYICGQLDEANAPHRTCGSIEEIIGWADIVYMTRIQRERFDEQEFARIRGHFNLNAGMLAPAKENMRILHPLPRVDEISPDVDDSPHACYFQQAANGLFARQAVLASILNEQP